jgi:MYXO-CTERM domain-containing protein
MQKTIGVLTLLVWSAIAGQAAIIQFDAPLLGANENPPVVSTGQGYALVTFDTTAHTLTVHAGFSDLVGTTTVAHIHCCTVPTGNAGVATYPGTFPGFPAGVTSGTYDSVTPIDLTLAASYTAAFLNNFGGGTPAGAEAALLQGLLDGQAYFNIHSTFSSSGEIRGTLSQVPEPGSFTLAGLALVALAAGYRRRRRAA